VLNARPFYYDAFKAPNIAVLWSVLCATLATLARRDLRNVRPFSWLRQISDGSCQISSPVSWGHRLQRSRYGSDSLCQLTMSRARSAGSFTFIQEATIFIADKKQADQSAANNCSGLVPVPRVRGAESLTSSELRDAPSRPTVVCALAVYITFSIWKLWSFPHASTNRPQCARRRCIGVECG
jgi:hypothetical protein